ncbi:MAG TPA: polysaccharide deacetylase family protein [Verrucomicrobiae bacterium]|nr:polysaccharide deacetylase family protein [Verrucomicrobiae bacterium]
MSAALPAYYSRLKPFRGLFDQATPILTYHKLGTRPGRVRLKGMYLGTRLFQQQMRELRDAGFSSGTLCDWNRASKKKIIITFDDGCVNVLRHGLKPLESAGFNAIQFLPADFIGKRNEWDVALGEAPEVIMDADQVREWISAGHEIGSHTLTHPYLTRIPPERARNEIADSRKKLEDLFGRAVEHFCYPFGDWNQQVRDMVAEAGYRTACTTDPGVNRPEDSAFSLKRFTARYPTRNLKNMLSWIRDGFGG